MVFSTVSCTLGADVELLALRGDQPINGTGNALDNTLWGFENSAANVLAGAPATTPTSSPTATPWWSCPARAPTRSTPMSTSC